MRRPPATEATQQRQAPGNSTTSTTSTPEPRSGPLVHHPEAALVAFVLFAMLLGFCWDELLTPVRHPAAWVLLALTGLFLVGIGARIALSDEDR